MATTVMPLTARAMATTATSPILPVLTPSLQAALPALYDTVLTPLDLSVGVVKKDSTTTLGQVATAGSDATVAFVVRRVG